MTITPVILAGGGGTRLWPLSREHYPKQFLKLGSEETLLQQTMRRLDGLSGSAAVDPPLIVCNEEHRFLVAEQARQLGMVPGGIILEPAGRSTAPALTIAALVCGNGGADPTMLMMPADHVIRDSAAFARAVHVGLGQARDGALVTFGVIPDRPETGYGYISAGPNVDADGVSLPIDGFVEKPDPETARRYVESGTYLWNSGIFMMSVSTWMSAIGRYRRDIHDACVRANATARLDGGFLRPDEAAFLACPGDSVDYAVMEKVAKDATMKAVVVPLAAGWSDVGAWSSLWEISARDSAGNVCIGDVCAIDSRDCMVISEHRLVAVLGCTDLVAIETADAVLVAPRNRAQEVRNVVEWLRQQGRTERLSHRRVYRPWGSYEGVDAGERFQVKRIVVNPEGKLSLQMHHHRAEHWIVVRGTARVTRGEEIFLLTENQSTYIPVGVRHRLENPGTIPLELIEVQSGPYLGEDDIVRFEDAYNRN
ncbi:MAG: mannose-1-phosphate guanylyltransferase/mannose-6-phosphate isomerase [Gammaproteobacteria bacterium]|nr:mannose-1-phosphate guanylyltransferase/mannose-6-phosphate isomerase [Gammaproteobacteria bacterium]MCG3144609.1 Alginate biosynthesis protein AlgA [Gammaproteobacteria bacterium]